MYLIESFYIMTLISDAFLPKVKSNSTVLGMMVGYGDGGVVVSTVVIGMVWLRNTGTAFTFDLNPIF